MTTSVAAATTDTMRGVAVVPSGTTVEGMSAVAGYIENRNPVGSPGTAGNAVALFGIGVSSANNAATWTLNTVCTDNTSQVISAGTGRSCENEIDMNFTSPNSVGAGLVLTGASLSQPPAVNAVVVNQLGTNIKWLGAFVAGDGAVVNGMSLGAALTTGANVSGVPVLLGYRDSGNVRQQWQYVVNAAGNLVFQDTGASHQFIVSASIVSNSTGVGANAPSNSHLFNYTDSGSVLRNYSITADSTGALVFGGTAASPAVTYTTAINYPAAVTGTPVASLCLDSSNKIIKKTTAGACI